MSTVTSQEKQRDVLFINSCIIPEEFETIKGIALFIEPDLYP